MRVQSVWYRYFLLSSLAMLALAGSAAGWLSAVILGLWLTPPVATGIPVKAVKAENAVRRPLDYYQIILDRNIFDSESTGEGVLTNATPAAASPAGSPTAAATAPSSPKSHPKLTLIGTITGPDALAVIGMGQKVGIYRLGEAIGDAIVKEIDRNQVLLRYHDGRRENLSVAGNSGQVGPASPPAGRTFRPAQVAMPAARPVVQKIGENTWVISRRTAEQARGNINDLLKQARLEPHIVNGQTQGFVVDMIRPGSFLSLLGLRRNDIVMQINDVVLNSPERALQIMQQLREARRIKLSLLRNNKPLTFEYEID